MGVVNEEGNLRFGDFHSIIKQARDGKPLPATKTLQAFLCNNQILSDSNLVQLMPTQRYTLKLLSAPIPTNGTGFSCNYHLPIYRPAKIPT